MPPRCSRAPAGAGHTVLGTVTGAVLALTVLSATGHAQAAQGDTAVRLTVGAFVDAYYAWDTGRPPTFDRAFAGGALFTTQPARHNEFNVNLAYIDVVMRGDRLRGRLALQVGTSVQSNYAGEATTGAVSGPSLARHVQEAVAGYRVAERVWIDAGIFASNLGMENWVSRDNPTYTRSLVAEYSPYYSSGVKLTWSATQRLTARVDVVNGWQNIAENNTGKGAGLRLDYAVTPTTTLSYYNFVSNEAGTRLRTFNGVGLKLADSVWSLLAEADVGTQSRGPRVGTSRWVNTAVIARRQLTARVGVSGRGEYTADPDQVVISTGAAVNGVLRNPALRALGASVGVDVQPEPRLLWRNEVRGWRNRDAVFPDGRTGAPRRQSAMVVSSLALTF